MVTICYVTKWLLTSHDKHLLFSAHQKYSHFESTQIWTKFERRRIGNEEYKDEKNGVFTEKLKTLQSFAYGILLYHYYDSL